MLPYFPQPRLHLFGETYIYTFGALVATGVLLGRQLVLKRAREAQIGEDEIQGAIWWAVAVGFICSHLVEMFFYRWDRLVSEGPIVLLKIFDGMSSYGGFLGAALGLFLYFRKIKKPKWWIHADCIIQGLVLGWIFGRLGCTVAHDHPGKASDFFLAFNYPDGPRHNLGFYEFLYTLFVLYPFILFLHARKPAVGSYCIYLVLLYAPFRFVMDFLRATDKSDSDVRYFGLTFAQYACIGVFLFALTYFGKLKRNELAPISGSAKHLSKAHKSG